MDNDARYGDGYTKTVERLEPEIHMIDTGSAAASMSISLKRIADNSDKLMALLTPTGAAAFMTAMEPFIEDMERRRP